MKKALLVAGGPLDRNQLRAELAEQPDLVVAVDGGGRHLVALGLYPRALIGDFDSLPGADLAVLSGAGVEIRRHPVKKDQTDLELALEYVIQEQAQTVRILGGLGGRIDHTLGNIGLLQRALENGVEASLINETHRIAIKDRPFNLAAEKGWAVSLIPLTAVVKEVATTGLTYPLNREDLYFTGSRGLHNQFAAETAGVTFKEGLLLVVLFKEE